MRETDVVKLEDIARQLRIEIVEMIYAAGDGHPGPALGIADLITVLYFGWMHIDEKNPDWSQRDRFILSKGHACPALYAALSMKGFFPKEELKTLRKFDSLLQGHPYSGKTPGVDATSGSLGNGLAIGIGMDIARKKMGEKWKTFVVLGDGEMQEGICWEAAATAAARGCDGLVAIVDCNGLQSGGKVEDIGGKSQLPEKWRSFGWETVCIDGNDIKRIRKALEASKNAKTPFVIIAKTNKGAGVSFIENNNDWHKKTPNKEEREKALLELGKTV